MFALVFPNGTQFSLNAREVANLLTSNDDTYMVRRYEAGDVIYATRGHDGEGLFYITAPAPNGLDMIYQAGGPQL